MAGDARHSPEPWRLEDGPEVHDGIVDAGGHLCAESWPGDTMNLDPGDPEQFIATQEANARRIVAAVNAVAGISTAALEAGALRRFIDFIIERDNDDGMEWGPETEPLVRALGRLP